MRDERRDDRAGGRQEQRREAAHRKPRGGQGAAEDDHADEAAQPALGGAVARRGRWRWRSCVGRMARGRARARDRRHAIPPNCMGAVDHTVYRWGMDDETTRTGEVMAAIRRRIASRALGPGDRLPSIRAFAVTMGVSPSTVVEAYDRLAAEGLIRARRGSGFYVAGTGLPPLALADAGPSPGPGGGPVLGLAAVAGRGCGDAEARLWLAAARLAARGRLPARGPGAGPRGRHAPVRLRQHARLAGPAAAARWRASRTRAWTCRPTSCC